MIIIPHTKGIISDKDKDNIPLKNYGRHSNGSEWLYFESEEEKLQFFTQNFPKTNQPIQNENPIIEAIKQMTEDEKNEIRNALNIQ